MPANLRLDLIYFAKPTRAPSYSEVPLVFIPIKTLYRHHTIGLTDTSAQKNGTAEYDHFMHGFPTPFK